MSDTQTPPPPAGPNYVQPPITCCTIDIRWVESQNQETGDVSRFYHAEVTDLSNAEPQSCSVNSLEVAPAGPFRGHFLGVLGAAVTALGEKAIAAFEAAPGVIILPDSPAPEEKKIVIQAYPDL